MGVGLPYAIGAKLAAPDQDVFCITGEGSIQMNIQELSTCFQYRVPVNVVTLNNGYLGMVRQWQELYYGSRESETYSTHCLILSNWLKPTAISASVWTRNPM